MSNDQKGGAAPTFEPSDWLLTEAGFSPDTQAVTETLLAQANGYIGTRGTPEEPVASGTTSIEGTYLNGVFVRDPIHYDEAAFGFADHNNKMALVPDAKTMRVHAGGQLLQQGGPTQQAQMRSLDMRNGLLSRTSRWRLEAGTLEINSRRLVSLAEQHLMLIDYDVASVDFSGEITLTTGLDSRYGTRREGFDPRAGALSVEDCLDLPLASECSAVGAMTVHPLVDGQRLLVSAYRLDVMGANNVEPITSDGFWGQEVRARLAPGQSIRLRKTIYYGDGAPGDEAKLAHAAQAALTAASQESFDAHLARQRDHLALFWNAADIQIDCDAPVLAGMRFNMFHLFQSAGKDGKRAIGAKGLTGPGYDGHYFWDTEIYAVPFFAFTNPQGARALLAYRIDKLEEARARARTMGHKHGALYPWRTIGGEECSSFFPAGTAQYHINAAIAYALMQYVTVSGDESLLHDGGAEMLFETARIWADLGHFSAHRGGAFCINEVTGPDEYTAMVDNNFYTNAMAQHHLAGAADLADRLEQTSPDTFQALASRLNLSLEERATWRKAAAAMYLAKDTARGLHAQCDGFFDKPEWNFTDSNSPLLLHYHPLVIYRHQVLKQPDVVLAQVLLPDLVTADEKARNLAYYEPRTTHDSTLSACVHAVANAESGNREKAHEFFEETYRMDLENRHSNTHYGVHIACMAGSWIALTYGFAGMRMQGETPSFNPYLPEGWRSYSFQIQLRGQYLSVAVADGHVTYRLTGGNDLSLEHGGTCHTVVSGTPLVLPLSP